MGYKSGFVALVGKPNVGKSTLLNTILEKKVAIATPKPQTTRDNIRGILTLPDAQIVFIDTPGIHKANIRLNEVMVQHAYDAIKDVDVILFLMDATKGYGKADRLIMESIAAIRKPKFLLINKIDKLMRSELIELLEQINHEEQIQIFDEIIPLSGLKKQNVDEVVQTLKRYLPEDVQYYPSDMISDYPERFMMAEIIREKILLFTQEEVPHSIAVVIENLQYKKNMVHIQAMIVCERDSQKRIIIGKQGQMVKKIGSTAREELQQRLGKNVYLECFVRVEENWRNKKAKLQAYGYWDTETDE